MQPAPLRENEQASLEALLALEVLDTAPEAEFDALVRAASLVCNTAISLISLVDADRQWFKANVGLPGVTETPRDTWRSVPTRSVSMKSSKSPMRRWMGASRTTRW